MDFSMNMKSRAYLLYAEDDPDDVLFLRDMLQFSDKKHSLHAVGDGFEVIRFLQEIKPGDPYPSLIILDIHMPKLNGIEVLKLLKTDDLYRMIPVLVFSNNIDDEHIATCRRLDTDLIEKPLYYTNWAPVIRKMQDYFDE